jgi:hypothetical protein
MNKEKQKQNITPFIFDSLAAILFSHHQKQKSKLPI